MPTGLGIGLCGHEHDSCLQPECDRVSSSQPCLHVPLQYEGAAADVYSCGVSLYVLLSGEFPFARAEEDADVTMVVRLQRELRRALAGDVKPLPRVGRVSNPKPTPHPDLTLNQGRGTLGCDKHVPRPGGCCQEL